MSESPDVQFALDQIFDPRTNMGFGIIDSRFDFNIDVWLPRGCTIHCREGFCRLPTPFLPSPAFAPSVTYRDGFPSPTMGNGHP